MFQVRTSMQRTLEYSFCCVPIQSMLAWILISAYHQKVLNRQITYAGGSLGLPLRKIRLKIIMKAIGPPCMIINRNTLSNPSYWLNPGLTTNGENRAPAPPDTLIENTANEVTMSLLAGLNQLDENCAGEFSMKTFPKATTVFPASTHAKLALTRHLKPTPMMTNTQLMLH